jgi:hypothetical protein
VPAITGLLPGSGRKQKSVLSGMPLKIDAEVFIPSRMAVHRCDDRPLIFSTSAKPGLYKHSPSGGSPETSKIFATFSHCKYHYHKLAIIYTISGNFPA